MELSDGSYQSFDADKFSVEEDNTLRLLRYNDETDKYKCVAIVHPDRWDSVAIGVET